MTERSPFPKPKHQFSWRTFAIGLIAGLALPYVVSAICSFFYLSDVMGFGAAGITNQAIWAIEARDTQRALRWSNKLIAIEPMREGGYALRGRAQEMAGRYHLALADFSVAVAYTDYPEGYFADHARVYQKLDLQPEAAREYARLVIALSNSPAPLTNTLPLFLSREHQMGEEGIRSSADLKQFFDRCSDETRELREVQRALDILLPVLDDELVGR